MHHKIKLSVLALSLACSAHSAFAATSNVDVYGVVTVSVDHSSGLTEDQIQAFNNLAHTSTRQFINSITSISSSAPGLLMNGAHHRPLMQSHLPTSGRCMWVTGDIVSNNDADLTQSLAEAGYCQKISNGAGMFGIGLGTSQVKQDMILGGKTEYTGYHLVAEADFRTESGILLSALGLYASGDVDIRRNFPILPSGVGTANGDTSANTVGARVRVDWVDAIEVGAFHLSPYASYSYIRTSQDGYTEAETNVRVHSLVTHNKQAMFGVAALTRIGSHTAFTLSIEGVHRFDTGATPNVTVFSPTDGDVGLQGTKADSDYIRMGVDADYTLNKDSVVSFSLHASTVEPGPAYIGSVSWRMSF